MNGEVLSRDRGYPLRVIVPGHIGARSVKWLRRITVQKEEAPHFHQQRDYKLFPPSIDWSNVEPLWAKMPSMQEINVQSAICDPCISRHTFFFSIKKKFFLYEQQWTAQTLARDPTKYMGMRCLVEVAVSTAST